MELYRKSVLKTRLKDNIEIGTETVWTKYMYNKSVPIFSCPNLY